MIRIHITGLDEAKRALNVNWPHVLQKITWGVGELVRGAIAKYPRPPRHPIHWQSQRQRFAYYAMRRRAGLPLAYTRQSDPMSQRLGPSWTVARRGTTDAVVGTKVTYAPFVQSFERQQIFHKETGWVTDKQAAEQVARSGDVERVAEMAVRKAVGA